MGSGFKNFTSTVLTAADLNNFCQSQSVMYFSSTGARDTQITSPVDGMTAYIGSNDSSEGFYTFNSTSWRRGPGWNAPWGFVAQTTSQSNTITSTYITGVDTTFTAVANRYYKITLHLSVASTIGRGIINLQDGFNIIRRVADQTDPVFDHLEGSHIATLTAGSHTIRATVNVISGSFTLLADSATNLHSLLIEDIGPSGAPV